MDLHDPQYVFLARMFLLTVFRWLWRVLVYSSD